MSKCQIIGITNTKGGVGKTATVFNLGGALAKMGKKVLLVDFDPQASLSQGIHPNYSIDPKIRKQNVYICLKDHYKLYQSIFFSEFENLHYLPGHNILINFEKEMLGEPYFETELKSLLDNEELKFKYDYILIDSPPFPGLINFNVLGASDYIIVPMKTTIENFSSLTPFHNEILKIEKRGYPLKKYMLFTGYDKRTRHNKQIVTEVLNEKILQEQYTFFKTIITQSTKIPDAYRANFPLAYWEKAGISGEQYMNLALEVIKNDISKKEETLYAESA